MRNDEYEGLVMYIYIYIKELCKKEDMCVNKLCVFCRSQWTWTNVFWNQSKERQE